MKAGVDKHAARFAESMIKAIEKGTASWQKPWKGHASEYPSNFKTNRFYNGSNLLLLLAVAAERDYPTPRWGGFGQIRKAGGHVRKGEPGTPILIVKPLRGRAKEVTDNQGEAEDERGGRGMYITMQHVWNVAQADGLSAEEPPDSTPIWDPVAAVEQVAADARIEILEQGSRACYSPTSDRITMPVRGAFEAGDAFYHTLLHELGHATAHPSRLDRPEFETMGRQGGTVAYALEELRAEMSAMMAGARLRIGHSPRHGQAYVAHWLKAAGDDPNCIRAAARDAQAMAAWLLRNHAESASDDRTPALPVAA